jgi:hypothetical protein
LLEYFPRNSTTFLDKVIVGVVAKNYPLLASMNLHYHAQEITTVPVLSQMNPVQVQQSINYRTKEKLQNLQIYTNYLDEIKDNIRTCFCQYYSMLSVTHESLMS